MNFWNMAKSHNPGDLKCQQEVLTSLNNAIICQTQIRLSLPWNQAWKWKRHMLQGLTSGNMNNTHWKKKKARPCQSYQNPKTGPGTDAHLSPEKRLKRPRKAKEGIWTPKKINIGLTSLYKKRKDYFSRPNGGRATSPPRTVGRTRRTHRYRKEKQKKKNNKERKKEKKCLHQGFNTGAYGHTQVTMLHSTYHNASGYVTSYPCFF